MSFPTGRRSKIAVAGASAALVVAAGVPLAMSSPAAADTERRGSCSDGNARYDIDVDRDNGRFEVNFEADSNVRNQAWRLSLRHDGNRVFRDVRSTDRDGEVEYERNRPDTKGADAFRARAINLRDGEICKMRVVRR